MMKRLMTISCFCIASTLVVSGQDIPETEIEEIKNYEKENVVEIPVEVTIEEFGGTEETVTVTKEYESIVPDNYTLDSGNFTIPESFEINADSLLRSWHVNYYTRNKPETVYSQESYVSDEVYMERLSRLPHVMEMSYNNVVKNCIGLYIDRKRYITEYMLGLADFYFPMIEQALDENNLPLELKYLAVVESALNPTALSRAGACGFWQFMLPTGKIYGLEINSLVDERRDPVKATYAACQYFKDMYEIYGDWNLVIAAYNCGPGNVNKAIRRAGGKKDYWAIYNHLPKETRSYVPLFIAVNYAMNYYYEHGLTPVLTDLPLSTDTIVVNRQVHFDQIAAVLNIDKELLRGLNPQYKRDIIPGNSKPRSITLPSTYAYAFASMEEQIYNYKSDELLANRSYVSPGGSTSKSSSNSERVVHKVKSGETLNIIANKYGVTVAQLKKWNGLKSNTIQTGKNLTVNVDNGGVALAENKSKTSNASTQQQVQVTKKTNTSTQRYIDTGQYSHYKVKAGDSFYTISQKYPGISAKDLMEINNMNTSKLKVGQVIKVPVG